MAEIATLFLSPLLQAFFEKVASGEFVDFFRRRKLDDGLLKKMKIALLSVNGVLEDAEEKQLKSPTVKTWLDELKDAVFDAEDILDEIDTESLRSKLDAEYQTTASKVRKSISTSLHPFAKKIEPKIKEVLERLEYLAKQKDVIGLKEGVGEKSSERLPTTSLFDKSSIFGRIDDKEAIIKSLLSHEESVGGLCVISIVGMGGLGKTALAQLVYDDNRVKDHFGLKAWVCVSNDFDVLKITKTIMEKVGSSTPGDDRKDLDSLQVALKENIMGKKYLIVLDDVWNGNCVDWELLTNPLRSGAHGSRIIATTRGNNVASVMRSSVTYPLKKLSEKDCWSLFAKQAFRDDELVGAYPELEAIGREIIKKCDGLPLAGKTLGSLLWSKLDINEWDKILKSELWDLEDDEVIPALRLSYQYLPSHLKPCFAYCSIFPQDYVFRKEELILLWMAEGFLLQYKDKTLEQVGDDYFRDLVARSLFQQTGYDGNSFVMHDLVNDLARLVSGPFVFRLKGDNFHEIGNKARHFSTFRKSFDDVKKSETQTLCNAKGLRTFLPLNSYGQIFSKELTHDLLPRLRYLRVLSLSGYENVTELPDSIGKMKHLRHLNLSSTAIRKLSDSVCDLCNLQTLELLGCTNLTELPDSIGKMKHLRHLVLFESSIRKLPDSVCELCHLQTLDLSRCTDLTELPDSIGKMKHLRYLDLSETSFRKLPDSVCELCNLQTLHLSRCKYLTVLPREMHKLVNLGHLYLENTPIKEMPIELGKLRNLQTLPKFVVSKHGGSSVRELGKLVNLRGSLSISKLQNVVSAADALDASLKNIKYLDDLVLEWTAEGNIEESRSVGVLNNLEPHTNLNELFIRGYSGTSFSDWVGRSSFSKMTSLYLSDCKSCRVLPPIGQLPSLERLEISGLDGIVTVGPEFYGTSACSSIKPFGALKSLSFRNMPAWEKWIASFGSEDGAFFSNLEELGISDCPKLTAALPIHLPSLAQLSINYCPQLVASIPRAPDLRKLVLTNCNGVPLQDLPAGLQQLSILDYDSLESLPKGIIDSNSCLLSTLHNLVISNCSKLELPIHFSFPSLQSLHLINSCDSLRSLPLNFISKIDSITISQCRNLESLEPQNEHEDLVATFISIYDCPNFVSFPNGGLRATNLTYFFVLNCTSLRSLPEKMHILLPSLKYFMIGDCPKIESFPEGGLPPTLIHISVRDCPKIESFPEGGLPPTLIHISVRDCPKIESFPEGGLPPTLIHIEVTNCDKLVASRMGWGLENLPSLENLEIGGKSEDVKSFPEAWLLPNSLTGLTISDFPSMESLDNKGLRHLTSLRYLNIHRCPKFKFLPEKGLPVSLRYLDIEQCPSLEKQLKKKKGKEWSTHVLCIKIGGEVI